ncbi:MAG: nucleotide exchange factor GrpE [Gammaproteobacteria bacterium]|nr:nucleotide exchange factor GrpE [Gammaproteobacteria bacterium]
MDKDQPEQPVEPQDKAAEAAAEESSAEETTTEGAETPAEDLTQLLEDARNKADEHWNQLVRTKAELDNLRKRSQRDLENAHKFSTEKFSQDLLQVWDSLELGHQAALDESADIDKLREGTELTLKLLVSVMQKNGIEQIDPMDESFNPEFHQAMSVQERDDVEPNTVVAVVQKGYLLNGRLMRPAMVMVSKAPVPSVDEQA